jgi:hypothetical protein
MGNGRAGVIGKLSWGAFFIGLGIIWLTKEYHQLDVWALVLVLGGCILIVQNLVRAAIRAGVSGASLAIGIVVLIVGASMLQEIRINLLGLALLLVGSWILLDVVAKRR